jgi:carboxylesterase type B
MDDLIFDTAMACTPETAQADRVKISAFQWRASKLAPKVYGDKSEVAVTGASGGAMQTETKLSLDPMEAMRAYQRMMGEGK